MTATTTTFIPTELWAGEVSECRKPCTVKSGQNLAANTVVMSDAAGKIVAHDGAYSNKVKGVLINAVDTDGADTAGMLYLDGDFIGAELVWPATINSTTPTSLTKQKLLEGGGNGELFATFYNAGEL
jgi:hypothetical protein